VTRAAKDMGAPATEFDWIEGDADIRVEVRGASADEAVAALDALRPRAAGLRSGFDPASAPDGYPLLGEHASGPVSGVAATFSYSTSQTSAPGLTVMTSTASAYPGYLRTWAGGRRTPEGAATEYQAGYGLLVGWPDGRQVIVQSRAAAPDVAELERIALGAHALDSSSAQSLAAATQARVAALAARGSVDIAGGTITQHGDGVFSGACLTVGDAAPVCSSPFDGGATTGAPDANLRAGSGVIDGQWYVFTASAVNAQFTVATDDASGRTLTATRGAIGSTTVSVLRVPDDVDAVQILLPVGDTQLGGAAFMRPVS
jgi:hypothetical protein